MRIKRLQTFMVLSVAFALINMLCFLEAVAFIDFTAQALFNFYVSIGNIIVYFILEDDLKSEILQ